VITPNESVTFVPRPEPSEGPAQVPVLLIVGDTKGRIPPGKARVMPFGGTVVVGRREATQSEPGQSFLVLPDRMVSSQHLAIGRAPERICRARTAPSWTGRRWSRRCGCTTGR